jgi:hypothetical protein
LVVLGFEQRVSHLLATTSATPPVLFALVIFQLCLVFLSSQHQTTIFLPMVPP